MLRFKIIRLCKEGFVQVEGPIKIIVLVPFVLGIVYFVVYRRLCKVELRTESRLEIPKQDCVTHLVRGDPHNVTWPKSTWSRQSDERQREGSPYFLWSSSRKIDKLTPLPSSQYASHHLVHAAPRGPGKRERGWK